MRLRLAPRDQPWLEKTFRVLAAAGLVYVVGILVLAAIGAGMWAVFLTMPAWMLVAGAIVRVPEAWVQLVDWLALGVSAVLNAILAFVLARLTVARW